MTASGDGSAGEPRRPPLRRPGSAPDEPAGEPVTSTAPAAPDTAEAPDPTTAGAANGANGAADDIEEVEVPELPPGVRLEDFYAHMESHVYIFVPTRKPWPAISINSRFGKGSSIWLDRNQPVEQITWAPGKPMIIKDRLILEGGWEAHEGVNAFNMYIPPPPSVLHGDPSQIDPWLEHIFQIYPDDAEHIIKWLAQKVQHPEVKINHALLLGGPQGIGKDTMLAPAKRAVGDWNVADVGPRHLTGQFNPHARSVILHVSEAHDLGSDLNRYGFYEAMKNYCAAPPDVLQINEKYLRQYYLPNVCGVVITTNHKTGGIYLPEDDRRHYVACSRVKRTAFDDAYWTARWRWYEAGGFGNVAAFLATLDLSDFNPKAPPPRTPAFWEIVNVGQPPEDAELRDVLDRMGNPDVLTLGSLKQAAVDNSFMDFHEWLDDRKNRRTIPHRLEACDYGAVRNPTASDSGLWVIDRRRQVIYGKGALTAAEQIKAIHRELAKARNDRTI